jgi:hypothetical protein
MINKGAAKSHANVIVQIVTYEYRFLGDFG